MDTRIVIRRTPYKVGNEIGHGLHSRVFGGQDLRNGRRVAIKIINFNSGSSPREPGAESKRKAYRKEIEMLLYLQPLNPHVIRVFNYESTDSYGVIVMERGETFRDTLAEYVSTRTKMPPGLVKRFWSQMVEAIYYMHQLGFVHGDCKPENFIQVGAGGTSLRLIDMGISFRLEPNITRRLITAAGTPDYVAPEMVDFAPGASGRSKYGYKADVWALGVILYEMVFGYRPLQEIGSNPTKLRYLGQLKQGIRIPDHPDKQLRDVLKRCLRCNHRQRPNIDQLLNHPYLSRAR